MSFKKPVVMSDKLREALAHLTTLEVQVRNQTTWTGVVKDELFQLMSQIDNNTDK